MGKNWAKHDAERDRLMAMVPAQLPEEVDQWIDDYCLGEKQYLFYNKRDHYAYCTHCHKHLDPRHIITVNHLDQTTCPECNFPVTARCIGKYRKSNGLMLEDIFQLRIMQRTPEGILIRRFELARQCQKHRGCVREVLSWFELQRVFNDGSTIKRYRQVTDGLDYAKNAWTYRWTESKMTEFAVRNNMGWLIKTDSFDYISNIKSVIRGTCFEYAKPDRRNLDYYSGWIRPVEYLEKTGWTELADDILAARTTGLRLKAQTVEKFLRLPKKYIEYARRGNLDFVELEFLRKMIASGEKIPDANLLKWMHRKSWEINAIKEIVPTICLTDTANYLTAHIKDDYCYRDYLKFCKLLNYDLTDKQILYPKNLKQAHDREMLRVEVAKNEIYDSAITGRFEEDLKQHGFHSPQYFIRPPRSAEELTIEGSKLHHCVATYIKDVASKSKTVLLVRRKANPEDPFYTMEVKTNGEMIQCRGDHNKAPTPEVAEFIRAWQDRKKKQKQKVSQIKEKIIAAAG